MLGSGSPMCQFMDASLCDSGADARGRVRLLKLPSQPPDKRDHQTNGFQTKGKNPTPT